MLQTLKKGMAFGSSDCPAAQGYGMFSCFKSGRTAPPDIRCFLDRPSCIADKRTVMSVSFTPVTTWFRATKIPRRKTRLFCVFHDDKRNGIYVKFFRMRGVPHENCFDRCIRGIREVPAGLCLRHLTGFAEKKQDATAAIYRIFLPFLTWCP